MEHYFECEGRRFPALSDPAKAEAAAIQFARVKSEEWGRPLDVTECRSYGRALEARYPPYWSHVYRTPNPRLIRELGAELYGAAYTFPDTL